MKTLSAALALAALLSFGANLAADEAKAEGGLAERLQDLNLTEDQETKIADIVKECRTKNAEAIKELASVVKEEMDKVRAVLTPEQREKLQTLKEERREAREDCLAHRLAHLRDVDLTDDEMEKIADIRKEFRPRIAKAMKGLEGLLNEEQRKAREEGLKAGKRRKEVLESLKLTDEQKPKVKAVLEEQDKKLQGVPREERRDKMREMRPEMSKKMKEILTPEQFTKYEQMRGPGGKGGGKSDGGEKKDSTEKKN